MVSAFLCVPGLFGKSSKMKGVDVLCKSLSACQTHLLSANMCSTCPVMWQDHCRAFEGPSSKQPQPLSFRSLDGHAILDNETCHAVGAASILYMGLLLLHLVQWVLWLMAARLLFLWSWCHGVRRLMTEFGQAMILSRSLYWSPASLTVLRIATATAVSSNIFNAATTVCWLVCRSCKKTGKPGAMACAYNFSYWGGWGRQTASLKPERKRNQRKWLYFNLWLLPWVSLGLGKMKGC